MFGKIIFKTLFNKNHDSFNEIKVSQNVKYSVTILDFIRVYFAVYL